VEAWIGAQRPHAIFIAAATVGGIMANSDRPAEFLSDNLAIESNIIQPLGKAGGQKLSCSRILHLPPDGTELLVEDALRTGLLALTNEWYAVAKIAGTKQCQCTGGNTNAISFPLCDHSLRTRRQLTRRGPQPRRRHVAGDDSSYKIRGRIGRDLGAGERRSEFLFVEILVYTLAA